MTTTTWEDRMAAKAAARAHERRLGYDTIASAERAELERWAILPPTRRRHRPNDQVLARHVSGLLPQSDPPL